MPYPDLYDVTYSYTGFQQSQQGISAFPGTQLDADLAGLEASIASLDTFMQTVIRSDGALNNGIVTFDSLSPSLQTAGIAPALAWLTATSYLVGIPVVQAGTLYRCLVSHTSGVFATDLAAGKWILVASLTTAFTAGANMTLSGGAFSVSTSPHFTTPNIDVATATSVNGMTISTTTGVLTIANGKTLKADNSLELAGTDGTVQTFPAASGNVVTSVTTAGGGLAGTYPNPSINSVPASALPNPTATTLGGVQSAAATAHNWISSISTAGVPVLSQPAFTDISGSVAATQMPAHSGDVTSTAGTVALTIAASAVTNAKMANMAAWTFKANNTNGAAAPTDITIDGLTAKASPAAGDEVIIWDVAGAALKKATVASVGSAGSVSSLGGNTGVFTLSHGITLVGNDIRLSFTNGALFATPANPAAITATGTAVHLGLGLAGCTLTPNNSGRVRLTFDGNYEFSALTYFNLQIRYGTGTAPANAAAATGTQVGTTTQNGAATASDESTFHNFSRTVIITGLTPGTAYWFDLAGFNTAAQTTTFANINCSVEEF